MLVDVSKCTSKVVTEIISQHILPTPPLSTHPIPLCALVLKKKLLTQK